MVKANPLVFDGLARIKHDEQVRVGRKILKRCIQAFRTNAQTVGHVRKKKASSVAHTQAALVAVRRARYFFIQPARQ
jgi:hypothetical protein